LCFNRGLIGVVVGPEVKPRVLVNTHIYPLRDSNQAYIE